jgi:hypothetical protein
MRTHVFVDGFNLYYGAVKGTAFRWLDIVALSKLLVPAGHTIERVKYFTARVSGAEDPDAPKRQHAYLSALATLPLVEIHYGRFLSKGVWRPILNFPVGGATIHSPVATSLPVGIHSVSGGSLKARSDLPVDVYPPRGARRPRGKKKKAPAPLPDALVAEVHTMEEKGSDVSLAAHLLNDAWKGLFQTAMVISTTPI